jgi:dTDP-4-dehydrorhamnose reductase
LAKVIHQIILQDIKGLIVVAGGKKIDKFNLLKLFNGTFKDKPLPISNNTTYEVDKSMYSVRKDFDYTVPPYETMIMEMKDWINSNNFLYNK